MAFTYGEYSESGDYTIEKKVKYVEYIESDGASWIDTGIITNGNTQIEVTAELINFDRYKSWFGSDTVSAGYQVQAQNLSFKIQGNGVSRNLGNTTYALGKHTWKIDTSNIEIGTERYTVNIDGVDLIPFTPSKNENPTRSLKVFSSNTHGDGGVLDTNNCCIQGRIYDFKIYMDNELIMHLKPCLDASKVPCMYDEVSKQYFYNQGTGTFIVGGYNLYLFADNQDNVATNLGNYRLYDMKIEGDTEGVESGINYVDCLIGDGNSYIDTGIAPTTDYTIDIEFMIGNQTNKFNTLYGSTGNAACGFSYSNGVALLSVYSSYGRYLKWIDEGKGLDIGKILGNVLYDNGAHINKRLNYSHKVVSATSSLSIYLFGNHWSNGYESLCEDAIRIYDFKIYNAEGTLIQHLRPCVDTSKVPCMYDEVSQQYFYNQGTGTFGYKKELRDFQPVLDSNSIPCLMDKINRKYYYNQGTGQFATQEQNYKRVSYLQGDGASYINTGLKSNTMAVNSYSIEIKRNDPNNSSLANQGVFGATDKNNPTDSRTFGEYYNYGYFANGGMSSYEDINNINGIITRKYIANSDTASNVSSQAEANVYLFALNGLQDSIAIKISDVIKIYYYKVWDGDGNLIQHFIPVLDQDNVPCMYDLVTETFFYNQGTGTFAYGIEELECPPVDYVDYIDNNYGVFKLDIERKANELIGVKYKFMFTDNTNSSHNSILSTSTGRDDGTGWIYFIPSLNGTQFITRMGWRASSATYNSSITFERHKEYEIEFDATSNKFIVNGVEMADTTTNSNSTQSYSLYLFSNDVSNVISNMRVYYVDIYKDYKLVGSYRPCLDSNGEICFYNSVNGNYIYQYNEDTTPTVGDTEITPIKYIESDGTQYIDKYNFH